MTTMEVAHHKVSKTDDVCKLLKEADQGWKDWKASKEKQIKLLYGQIGLAANLAELMDSSSQVHEKCIEFSKKKNISVKRKNDHLMLAIKLCLRVNDKRASKYLRAVRYLLEIGYVPHEISQALKIHGGISKCAEAPLSTTPEGNVTPKKSEKLSKTADKTDKKKKQPTEHTKTAKVRRKLPRLLSRFIRKQAKKLGADTVIAEVSIRPHDVVITKVQSA